MENAYPRTTLLRLVRVARGLQQLQLARAAGITPGQISLYEAGLAVPTFKRAQRLARAICLPLDLLTAEVELVLLDDRLNARDVAGAGRVVAVLRVPAGDQAAP